MRNVKCFLISHKEILEQSWMLMNGFIHIHVYFDRGEVKAYCLAYYPVTTSMHVLVEITHFLLYNTNLAENSSDMKL